jgi:hypothetical protein
VPKAELVLPSLKLFDRHLPNMALRSDNTWENKYQFHSLEIGQEMFVPGKLGNIRSAASMWGRRRAVWLTVRPTEGGAIVKRMFAPKGKKRNQQIEIITALRTLTLLVLQIKKTLEERE